MARAQSDSRGVDEEWKALVALSMSVEAQASDSTPLSEEAARKAQAHLEVRDAAKRFQSEHPAHEAAPKARKLEVLSILRAASLGDASSLETMSGTVSGFRGDPSLPIEDRVEVAGTHDFMVATRSGRNRAGRLAACERAARGLIAEFPSMPQGYLSLLTVALASDSEKGRALASELLTLPAPPDVQKEAQAFLERLSGPNP